MEHAADLPAWEAMDGVTFAVNGLGGRPDLCDGGFWELIVTSSLFLYPLLAASLKATWLSCAEDRMIGLAVWGLVTFADCYESSFWDYCLSVLTPKAEATRKLA